MKPRLLIFHRTIAPYRIDFFNSLSKAFETRICLQYKNLLNQKFDYEKILEQLDFSPVYLKEFARVKNTIISTGFWKKLNETNPDIVLVSEFGLDCIATLLHKWFYRKKYKVVSVCDDSYNMVAENNDFSKIHRLLRQWIVPILDELILVEPKVTAWYLEKYGKGVWFPIIKNEIIVREQYKNLLSISSDTVKKYRLENKKVFLFVGRLVALKNVDTIINAFSQLNNDRTALVVVGDGPERNRLEKLASSKESCIIFTGRLEGDVLYQWYNIANCFILASYQEPFGAVTNEALLAGCKCIISNKAGSQCLIDEGVNGYKIDPMDTEGLTSKMRQIIEECLPVDFKALRPSQMPFTYHQSISELIEHLNEIITIQKK